jgi:hypothetical protein
MWAQLLLQLLQQLLLMVHLQGRADLSIHAATPM